MVQVQSTWFPVIDRNPQKFVPPATQRILCTPGMLPVITGQ